MSDLRAWHKPKFKLLDARATAQTDADATLSDPNGNGDLPETSETHTWTPFSGANHHAQADS